MALTERHRSILYQRLNQVVHDEEAVGAMLSYFPARDLDEPATKDFVAASTADLRADFADLRGEFADLRSDFADLRSDFADLRADMATMETRLTTFVHQEIRSSMRWTIGFFVSVQTSLVAALAVFT